MIEFAWPWIFLLVPLPWLIYRLFPESRLHKQAALLVSDWQDFDGFKHASYPSISSFKVIFAAVVWLVLLVSAARPQWVGDAIEIPQSGRDLMLAVDLSGSMQIQDFELQGKGVDRLTALKRIAGEFIERRKGDRIGLILFGSNAYLQAPLTFDLATVKQFLNEAVVGLAGKETAIGDAIGLAVKQMRHSPKESQVLILLTDGNNNAGELELEKAAEIAARSHVKIYSVAIGAKEVYMQTLFGRQKMNPSADLDEKSLKMVAEKTGGEYFRAYNADELSKIYQHIDRLEVIEKNPQYYLPKEELYAWPLGAAMLCALIALGGFELKKRLA